MEWIDIRDLIEAMQKDLFMLTAPTQPLTALETVRTQFREAVMVFKSSPTKEGALEVVQLAQQLLDLAKQTPGFDLPSHAFAALKGEIDAGLEIVKDLSDTQLPIERRVGFSAGRVTSTAAMRAVEKEIIFLVEESPEGGYQARALGYPIFTEADTFEELKRMAQDAVRCYFEETERPSLIRLRLVKDEVIAV